MDAYRVWEIKPLENIAAAGSKENQYRHLIGWAVLAPNSHNSQPWRFVADTKNDLIEIRLPAANVLAASDAKSRQAYISVGCAIQNLYLAAQYYGFNPQISYLSRAVDVESAAVLKLAPTTSSRADLKPLLLAMTSRRVNRGKYQSQRPVPPNLIGEIKNSVQAFSCAFNEIGDAVTRFAIAEIQYLAERAVIAMNSFRHELANYLLPNNTGSKIGMPGDTFGLSDEMSLKVHNELKKEGVFDPDLAVGFAASSRDAIRSSPLIGVISVAQDNPLNWLKAGQALQQTALLIEKAGLAMAVHAAMVEVGMFNQVLKLRLGQSRRPTVIFRVGYPTEARPHSPRLAPDGVTIFK